MRDIARNIERQITDGLIDARAAGAKKVRIVKQGDKVAIVPAAEASDARAVRAPEGGPIAKSAAS